MLNSSIIVNVGDLVHGLSTLSLSGRARAKQCKAESGGRNGIRIESRSGDL